MKHNLNQIVIILLSSIVIALFLYVFLMEANQGPEIDVDMFSDKNPGGFAVLTTLLAKLGYKITVTNTLPETKENYLAVIFDSGKSNENNEETESDSEIDYKKWHNDLIKSGKDIFYFGFQNEKYYIENCLVKEGTPDKLIFSPEINMDVGDLSITSDVYLVGNGENLIGNDQGGILYRESSRKNGFYILTDSSLFNNGHMRSDENIAVLLNNIFTPYYDIQIYFYTDEIPDKTLKNPVFILFDGKLVFLSLQVILVIFLFLWRRTIRFGNVMTDISPVSRTLESHLQAVGRLFERGRSHAFLDEIETVFFEHHMSAFLKIKTPFSWDSLNHATAETDNDIRDSLEILYNQSGTLKNENLLLRSKLRAQILKKEHLWRRTKQLKKST